MLTRLRDLSNSINVPEDFIRQISIYPEKTNMIITTALFNQYREHSSYLIHTLNKELKSANFGNLLLTFEENATLNGLNRNIILEGKVDKSYDTQLLQFKKDFFKAMSCTAEFIAIKQSKVWKVITGRSIGDIFLSPSKLYDLNANPIEMPFRFKKLTLLLIWHKEEQLINFMNSLTEQIKRESLKMDIIAVSIINDNFFKRKDFLSKNGYTENITHYFEQDPTNTYFTYGPDTTIMFINTEGVIVYDKLWQGENISMIYNKVIQGEKFLWYNESDALYINANEWWWTADNRTKQSYIDMIHEKLNEMELNEIYFSMYSKAIMNNTGEIIQLVHPQFAGTIELEYKDYLDQFLDALKTSGKLDNIELIVTYIQ